MRRIIRVLVEWMVIISCVATLIVFLLLLKNREITFTKEESNAKDYRNVPYLVNSDSAVTEKYVSEITIMGIRFCLPMLVSDLPAGCELSETVKVGKNAGNSMFRGKLITDDNTRQLAEVYVMAENDKMKNAIIVGMNYDYWEGWSGTGAGALSSEKFYDGMSLFAGKVEALDVGYAIAFFNTAVRELVPVASSQQIAYFTAATDYSRKSRDPLLRVRHYFISATRDPRIGQ